MHNWYLRVGRCAGRNGKQNRPIEMIPLTKEQQARLGLELATMRQEHGDLDAAIHALTATGTADQMLVQRLKKRKLRLKDRIVELENLLLPDIIA